MEFSIDQIAFFFKSIEKALKIAVEVVCNTFFFHFCLHYKQLINGNAIASDDLQEVKWFEVIKLDEMIAHGIIAEEHKPLVELLQKKLIKNETKFFTQNFEL